MEDKGPKRLPFLLSATKKREDKAVIIISTINDVNILSTRRKTNSRERLNIIPENDRPLFFDKNILEKC